MDKKKFVVIESNPKHKKKKIIIPTIIFLIAIAIILLVTQFKIKKINISGTTHYTDEAMIKQLKNHKYVNNTLLYSLSCKINTPDNIPFVETFDVEIVDRNTISVTIYEKTLAGCVENMGDFMYFDKDGIVLESSKRRFDDVPIVRGLDFDSVVVNEKLPFKNKKTVSQILNITQLIRKYKLDVKTIKFDGDEVFLYTTNIEINLGDPANVDEKMAELPNMLEKAEDLCGTLHMENFTVNSGVATFVPK